MVRFALKGPITPVLTGIPKGHTGNGGRLTFGSDGMLYIGTGDAGRPALSADRRSLAGKVLRVDTFGRPDKDNTKPRPLRRSTRSATAGWPGSASAGSTRSTRPSRGRAARTRSTGSRPAGTTAGRAAPGPARRRRTGKSRPRPAGCSGFAIIERGLFITSTTGRRLYALPLDGSGQPGSPADYLIGAYGRLRTVVAAPDGALWLTTSNKEAAGKPTRRTTASSASCRRPAPPTPPPEDGP